MTKGSRVGEQNDRVLRVAFVVLDKVCDQNMLDRGFLSRSTGFNQNGNKDIIAAKSSSSCCCRTTQLPC